MISNRVGLFTAAALLGLSACSSDDDDNKAETLSFSSCESSTTLECAELQVPMDYSNENGEQISLALIRMPAPASTRQGALLFNPGGPGGSGVDLIRIFEEIASIPDPVLAAYDIVGFDPRGVGDSTPVDCEELGLDDIDAYPVGDQRVREMHTVISEFSADCSEKEGRYLQLLGSINVVRDMDEIRKALGEDKLNFIGYSYGTRLAALYLQEYPQTSGRIVLDGSVLPDSSVIRLVQESLPVVQSNLRTLLSQCEVTDPNCSVDQLLNRLTERVSALSADPSDEAAVELEIFGELLIVSVQEPEFGMFAAQTIISYLNTYDVAVLEQFAQQLESLGEDFEGDDSDSETAQIAVMCADDSYRPSADDLTTLLGELNALSDPFAEAQLVLAAMCAGWPEALEPLAPIATGTAPVSLVIGGTTDAQTPLQWSEVMAQAIGGVYIRSEHLGHTAVFAEESDCIDGMVAKFLLDGMTPADNECN